MSLGLGGKVDTWRGGCRVRVCVCVLGVDTWRVAVMRVCVCALSRHVAVAFVRLCVCVRMCVCVHVSLSRHGRWLASVCVCVCPE